MKTALQAVQITGALFAFGVMIGFMSLTGQSNELIEAVNLTSINLPQLVNLTLDDGLRL